MEIAVQLQFKMNPRVCDVDGGIGNELAIIRGHHGA